MIDRLIPLFRGLLPAVYWVPRHELLSRRVFLSFALMRSGQHVVIDWICRGLGGGAFHFNLCGFIRSGLRYELWPYNGRWRRYAQAEGHGPGEQGLEAFRASPPRPLAPNLFFSTEDQTPDDPKFADLVRRHRSIPVIIVRDPANWLASSLRHEFHPPATLRSHMGKLKAHLRYALAGEVGGQPVLAIDYNRFVAQPDFRRSLAERLDPFEMEAAEGALEKTARYGGGSSFEGLAATSANTLDRWKAFAGDAFFREALDDPELLDLARRFFGPTPPVEQLARFVTDPG